MGANDIIREARIKDAALRQAQELRREAIDDFWRGADAAWAATLGGAQRSARRLAQRLIRHAELRQTNRHLEG